MLRRRKKRSARAIALARSEIHPDRCDDRAAVEYEMRKCALAQISASKKAIRQFRKDNFKVGRKLNRDEAEQIVGQHFAENSDSWIRAVGWLVGQGYAASRFYYLKELPAIIEAEEAANDDDGGVIDVDSIIKRELGDDPDLSF